MSDMKMSDIWGWDSIPQNYGTYDSFTYNDIERKGECYGFMFHTKEAAGAVAHAVRVHDKNQETIAQLKDNQSIAIQVLKEIANNGKLDKLDMSELAFDALLKMNKGDSNE